MEDPIRFDLWGVVVKEELGQCNEVIASFRPDLSRLEALKLTNKSAVDSAQVLLLRGAAWQNIQKFVRSPPSWLTSITVYQEGWEPSDQTEHCGKHDLWYGGCLGCHVCSGFYVEKEEYE